MWETSCELDGRTYRAPVVYSTGCDRQQLPAALAGLSGTVAVTVTGQLADGHRWVGTDSLRVIP